ncbi:hypothetical protein HK104_004438 [Borealophlyctis nickersoniae]|nr:hypothetical protein HK104_004438 [Borealophlyctis nickersoniae]
MTNLIKLIALSLALVASASAVTQDAQCQNAGGICQNDSASCDGGYKTGLCPSSATGIRCCVPSQDSKCTQNAGGMCKFTSTPCTGGKEYLTGYCPSSGNNIKCCASTAGDGIKQDAQCTDIGGNCQNTSKACAAGYKSGLCPSSGDGIKCCPPSGGIEQDAKCKNAGGICQNTSKSCPAGYLSGYCPSSGNSIKCCRPSGGITQDEECTDIGGKCQTTSSACAVGYLSGYCPSSGDSVKCCAKKPPAPPAGSSPCAVPKTRDGIVKAAMWAHNSGTQIHYTQSSPRWSGISQHHCPHQSLPPDADCSSFATWIYWSAFGNQADILNGQSWKAGYTGTMQDHGRRVSFADAKLGDLVFYSDPAHVTILVDKSPAKVVSFGSSGPVNYVNMNYRTVTEIRTYDFF